MTCYKLTVDAKKTCENTAYLSHETPSRPCTCNVHVDSHLHLNEMFLTQKLVPIHVHVCMPLHSLMICMYMYVCYPTLIFDASNVQCPKYVCA